jgi:hypothetical protein
MIILAALTCLAPSASGAPAGDLVLDYQREHLGLNGTWQALPQEGDAEVFRPEAAGPAADGTNWRARTLPGILADLPSTTTKPTDAWAMLKTVWVRRRFTLSAAQAVRDAVLKHNGIRFGATTWINARKVDEHPTIGPNTVLIPRGLLRTGENEVVLKVCGWGGVPRSARNRPLVPTGASTQTWGAKAPEVFDDIWLEFYDRAYVRWALAMPDLQAGRVTFRVLLDAVDTPDRVRLTAIVRQEGRAIGQATVTLAPAGAPIDLPVALKDAKLWSPNLPCLCRAELIVTTGDTGREQTCDSVAFTFGMREIRIESGRYRLNGRPIWFRGSNLVNEWHWGDTFKGKAKAYLVDEGRSMNLNSFRTHTIPPPTDWADVCDRHGTMLFAELPVLYNGSSMKFTPAEYEVFHAHALADAADWITKLWNHPSIMMWVISNESVGDDAWEAGPYWRRVKDLDPTRPAMRADAETPDVVDLHTCGNFLDDGEGDVPTDADRRARARDPQRTLGNSEYMNLFGSTDRMYTKWLGRPDHPDGPLVFAEFAMEHTEAFRRAGYDLVLPYMYAGWTATRNAARPAWRPWRPDWPAPISAVLHSVMSPVLASLDLYDRNYRPGQQVATDAVLINELGREVSATLELHLTPRDPLFIPDEAVLAAGVLLSRETIRLQPYSMTRHKLTWRAPAQPGSAFLAAVLRRPEAKPVVSQRVVRSIPAAESDLAGRRVAVLGSDKTIRAWLASQRATVADAGADEPISADVLLVWDHRTVTDAERARTAAVLDFVKSGGRLVVFQHGQEWTWKDLLDLEALVGRASRAFAVPGAAHRFLNGIEPEWLKRWNGMARPIADSSIQGAFLKDATPLLWMEKPDRVCTATLPLGKGEVVVTTLHVQDRVDPACDAYDPAADRILFNLLAP